MTSRAAATTTSSDAEVAELASHLRLAVARLNRRIRQQAATTGEELTASTQAALAIDRTARPDHPGRARGGRAGAAAEHDPHRGPARGVEYVTRVVDPADRRVARVAITDAGARPAGAQPHARRTPTSHSASPSSTASEQALLARALPLLERLQDDAP